MPRSHTDAHERNTCAGWCVRVGCGPFAISKRWTDHCALVVLGGLIDSYAWNTPLNVSTWTNTTDVYPSHPHIPGLLWIDEYSQPSYDMCYLQVGCLRVCERVSERMCERGGGGGSWHGLCHHVCSHHAHPHIVFYSHHPLVLERLCNS